MMKKLLCSIICIAGLSLSLPTDTFSYFENSFLCTIEETSITVSLHDGEKPCFDYIKKVATKINTLQEDIKIAQQYIESNRDVEYRNTIKDTLSNDKVNYEFSRKQIITAMGDYEGELFLRIKVLVYFYLKPEREATDEKIAQADVLLLRMRLAGNDDQYVTVRRKRNELYRERLLLDAIKHASTFEELVFPLKTYLDSQEESTTLPQEI